MGEFPSGQRGQTVNLLSVTSVVRIHLPPPERKPCSCNGYRVLLFSVYNAHVPNLRQFYDNQRFSTISSEYVNTSGARYQQLRSYFPRRNAYFPRRNATGYTPAHIPPPIPLLACCQGVNGEPVHHPQIFKNQIWYHATKFQTMYTCNPFLSTLFTFMYTLFALRAFLAVRTG